MKVHRTCYEDISHFHSPACPRTAKGGFKVNSNLTRVFRVSQQCIQWTHVALTGWQHAEFSSVSTGCARSMGPVAVLPVLHSHKGLQARMKVFICPVTDGKADTQGEFPPTDWQLTAESMRDRKTQTLLSSLWVNAGPWSMSRRGRLLKDRQHSNKGNLSGTS